MSDQSLGPVESVYTLISERIPKSFGSSKSGKSPSSFAPLSDSQGQLRCSLTANKEKQFAANKAADYIDENSSKVSEISSKLEQIKELASKASSGEYSSEDIEQFQEEYEELVEDIDSLSSSKVDGKELLDGSESYVSLEIGSALSIDVKGQDLSAKALGVAGLDLAESPAAAESAVNDAIGETAEYSEHLEERAEKVDITQSTLEVQQYALTWADNQMESFDQAMMTIALDVSGWMSEDTSTALLAQGNIDSNAVLNLLNDN
jgi:flagellin-like hook-associated protein FlgL